MNFLEQLKGMTEVVADTGDFKSIEQFKPVDATTNPSLLYSAAQDEKYSDLIEDAVFCANKYASRSDKKLDICIDKLAVNFGLEILKIVPRRVSTEVNARLSFDTDRTIEKARQLIQLYEDKSIDRERILIKIASTWEGIKAAEVLEKEDIHCNLTLLFSEAQAVACAEAGVKLISPFVGRIYDWYKKDRGVEEISPAEDPGVLSVYNIYNYFKKFGYDTEVMGASFRNIGEIVELAGCDLLTISPKLLLELENQEGTLEQKLSNDSAKTSSVEKIEINEKLFRWMLNENAMATEKLSEGIRKFYTDLVKLEKLMADKLT